MAACASLSTDRNANIDESCNLPMEHFFKNKSLWYALAVSLCIHLYALPILMGAGWPALDYPFHSEVLIVDIVGSPLVREPVEPLNPVPAKQPAEVLHSPEIVEQEPQSKASYEKKESQLPRQTLADQTPDRQLVQSIPELDQPSSSIEIINPNLNIHQGKAEKPKESETLTAEMLVSKSIDMIRNDPYWGGEDSEDFTQYLLMKKLDEVKHLIPGLLEQPQLSKDKAVEE